MSTLKTQDRLKTKGFSSNEDDEWEQCLANDDFPNNFDEGQNNFNQSGVKVSFLQMYRNTWPIQVSPTRLSKSVFSPLLLLDLKCVLLFR